MLRFKKIKIFTLLIILLIGTGIYFVFSPLTPVLSDEAAKHDLDILPANLPPKDYVITDLHLPSNKIVRQLAVNSELSKEDELPANPDPKVKPKVKGVSYNKQAVADLQSVSKVNRIIIPKMGVDDVILEGKTAETLWKGIWRMPVGSTPNQGGNTIITAHRYLYRPPSPKTFYLIDKLEPGDKITVYWEGKRYEYEVTGSKVVEPTEVSILHNTPSPQLTLFSCTPLFTSKQRLVVTAKLLPVE